MGTRAIRRRGFRWVMALAGWGSLLAGALAPAPAEAVGPFRGRVVDVETGEPVAGVVLLAVWVVPGAHRINLLNPADSTDPTTEVLTQADGRFTLPARRSRHEWPRLALFKAGYGGWRLEGGIDALLTDGTRIELRHLRDPAAQRAYLEGRARPADGGALETGWREASGPDIPFGVRRASARCYEAALNTARARAGLPRIEVHATDGARLVTGPPGRSCTPARPAGPPTPVPASER